MLVNNQLTLSDGQTVVLSSNNLEATEPGVSDSGLTFTVGNVENGYFALVPVSGADVQLINTFTQQTVNAGQVEFTHLGNEHAPGYAVTVSDGNRTSPPSQAMINFSGAPVVTQNTVLIQPGQTVTLTPANLNVTVNDGSTPDQVVLQVSDVQHAILTSTQTGTDVSNFTLGDVQAGYIQLTQDGSLVAPSYTVAATSPGSGITSAPSTVDIQFSSQGIPAPRLLNNYLLVIEGATTTLTSQNVAALQGNQSVTDSALFYVSDVSHGYFSLNQDPDVWIPFFSQQQLQNLSVQFTHDGSKIVPGYRTAVEAGGLQSPSLAAAIFFRTVNQPPVLAKSLPGQTIQAGQPFSYTILPGTFIDPQGEPVTLSVGRFNSTLPLPAWLAFDTGINRLSGVPDTSGSLDIGVTARDPEGLVSAPADFILTIASQLAASNGVSLEKTVASAVASGLVGLFFLGLQIYLKRAANKKLAHALGDGSDPFDLNVVRPVAKEIARQVKVTGCMNHTTNSEMVHFKAAVRTLLTELDQRGVDLRFTEMTEIRRDGLINEIAVQTRLRLAPKGYCTSLMKFFKAQTTPEAIRLAAADIAANVVKSLTGRNVSVLKPQGQQSVVELSAEPPRDSNSIAIPALELKRLEEDQEGLQGRESKEEVTLVEDDVLSSSRSPLAVVRAESGASQDILLRRRSSDSRIFTNKQRSPAQSDNSSISLESPR